MRNITWQLAIALAAFFACTSNDDEQRQMTPGAASEGGFGATAGADSAGVDDDGGAATDAETASGGAEAAGGSKPAGEAGATLLPPDSNGAAGAAALDSAAAINGCTESAYVHRGAATDERVIEVGKVGLMFTPKCLVVTAGQSVRWEGNLSAHPLAPGNPQDPLAGTADSPIASTSTGTSAEFRFERAGVFPYYCELHAFGAGQGMAGVVVVQ